MHREGPITAAPMMATDGGRRATSNTTPLTEREFDRCRMRKQARTAQALLDRAEPSSLFFSPLLSEPCCHGGSRRVEHSRHREERRRPVDFASSAGAFAAERFDGTYQGQLPHSSSMNTRALPPV
jgi:hypothetical protein